jgi:zinc protease
MWIPTFDRNMREVMEDRVPQARIYRFYHVPGWSDPELQYLDLFGSVLSGSRSARLDKRLLYEKELVTGISAGTWKKELASNFIVTATVKAGVDPAEVEKEIDAIVGELIAKGPTAEELRRAQSRDLAAFTRGMERLGGFGGRSDLLAESMTFGGDPSAYLDRLETKATATPDQVRRAGAKWLDANHYTMLVTPFPKLEAKKDELDRSILPPLGEAPEVRFPELQRAKLNNGLDVILLERRSVPIVNFALAVDAGYAADSPETAGLASLALNLMDDGTSSRDTFRIVDELDALGARIFTSSTLDLSLVRLQAMPAHLAPSLEIFADVILNPSFPADLVELEKRRRLAQIEQERAQPTAAALRVLPTILFGKEHAYGNPLTGSGFERTVGPLTRDALAGWHRTWFKPNNATLVVTGDVTMDTLLPALERAFSAWKGGEVPQKKLDTVAATAGGKVYLIDKPGAPQSVIVAAHLSEPGGQQDELAIEAAMRNFGGMATSRLNRNLRLDKHWSYGAQGLLYGARGQRPMLVIAPVQTDKTTEAMAEVAKELREVAGERPVAGEEFASLMRNMTMRLPGRFETLSSIESAAIEMLTYNYPDDYYQRYAGEIRGLTESDLAGASSRYIRPREAVWLIIGDREKIETGVRQLGFGEIVPLEGER